jgi:hypothetical protein
LKGCVKQNASSRYMSFLFRVNSLLIDEASKIPRIKFESGIIKSQRNQKNI